MPKQRVLIARVVYEPTEPRYISKADRDVVKALKQSFQYLRDVNVAIAVYDESDKQVGRDETGEPSAEMRRLIRLEMDDEAVPA